LGILLDARENGKAATSLNIRDLLIIAGIAFGLLAVVSGFEFLLRGAPEIPEYTEQQIAAPSLTVDSRSNVRAGDSTGHPVVGKLQAGESATILAISQGRAGWYYIEMPDGARGFISPDIVRTEGDLTNLPTIDPASLSATARPDPATAFPSQAAATAVASETQPATPTARG